MMVSEMQHFKNITKLYRLDWKRIFNNPMTTFLVIALMFLPSLYAWFNIKALWDPYGNTKEIPIAVFSGDTGTDFNGKKINVGDEVIENLQKNEQLGWRFVKSEKVLKEGVQSGKFYAGIYLPTNFSEDLLSFTSGEIQKPTIDYYFNEKINAIAPKITDKGASSLQDQITENFINTASSTLLEVFNLVGYEVESNLVSINKVKNLILEMDQNSDNIEGYTQEILALHEKLPDIKNKLNKAEEFTEYLPEVDQMAEKLVVLNQKMPQITEEAKIILTLQDKIPEIQNAGKQLAMVDEDFAQVSTTLTEGIAEANQALMIMQEVDSLLPKIVELRDNASDFTDQTIAAGEKLDTHLDEITQTVQINLNMVTSLAETINHYAVTLNSLLSQTEDWTPEQRAIIKQTLLGIADVLAKQQAMISDLIDWFQQLQQQLEGDFSEIIQHLNQANELLAVTSQSATQLAEITDSISKTELQQFLSDLQLLTERLASLGNSIDVEAVSRQVHVLLENKLLPALENTQELLEASKNVDLEALLQATEKTVSNAVTILEKYQEELPAIGREIHDANLLLNGHMDQIVNGINKGVSLYNEELPELQEKLAKAADFVTNEYPTVKSEVVTTLEMVDEKFPKVETALNTASQLIEEDWPSMKRGIHKAAMAIHKGEEFADLNDIISLLKNDVQAESDFFTQPVELNTTAMYPMENNGSASTPFYTALCLWVGALLLSSVAATDFHLDKKDRQRFSQREMFLARMGTFLTIGLAQSLIVTLGNYFVLGVDVRNPVYSILFAILVGWVFMTMIYVFASLFGNLGKGIGIILLVLSISGGGGNYPIQVSGKFFQFINPLLPFTYAVDLLRESAGGIYWPNAVRNASVLLILGLIFGIVGTLVSPLMEKPLKKMNALTKESHFFH